MRDSSTRLFVCSRTCRWCACRTACSEVEARPTADRPVLSAMVEHGARGRCMLASSRGPPACTCHTSETLLTTILTQPHRFLYYHARNIGSIEYAPWVPRPWDKILPDRADGLHGMRRPRGWAYVLLRDMRWQQRRSMSCGNSRCDGRAHGGLAAWD